VIDNSWYLTPYHVGRDDYEDRPYHPLQGVNITAEDYVQGELEDWAPGAVKLNGQDQYFKISNATLTEPYEYTRKNETVTVTGKDLKNPMVHDTSFIVEAYFKVEEGDAGVLAQNTDGSVGWALQVQDDGTLRFAVQDGSNTVNATSGTPVNGGSWHHVLAEVDRENDKITLFLDGKAGAGAEGVSTLGTLANSGDFLVGGTPDGAHLAVTLDFLRVALGSLEQSKTRIEELVAWQFDGPFLRDFTGAGPTGEKRDAGALELQQ
jgi:hypothetical protein